MPCRTICNKAIPPVGPPFFGDARPLKHKMINAVLTKMFTRGDACLASANDDCIHLVFAHEASS